MVAWQKLKELLKIFSCSGFPQQEMQMEATLDEIIIIITIIIIIIIIIILMFLIFYYFCFVQGNFAHAGFPEIAFGRYSDTLIQKGYK